MCLCVIDVRQFFENRKTLYIGLGMATAFAICSVFMWKVGNEVERFLCGIVACTAIVLVFGYLFKNNAKKRLLAFGTNYTMSIFLMHTIFAAALRSLLFKVGITNAIVHVLLGLVISFVGPVIATEIIKKFSWLEFLLYPTKYVKVRNKSRK